MLHKVGQTVNRIKLFFQQIYYAIKHRFSVKQRKFLNDNAHSINHSKDMTLAGYVGVGENGELSASTIIAKIGEHKANSNYDKMTPTIKKVSAQKKKQIQVTESTTYSPINDEELLFNKNGDDLNQTDEMSMKEIQKDLAEALEHWKWTQHAYNHALGSDQVDFYIYQMMAAEQKYRMILLKARRLQVDWSKVKGDLV